MGYVQMSFAASQVLGLPIGLILANHFGWHSPFWMIGVVAIISWIIISLRMKPVTAHLKSGYETNAFEHLWKTLSRKIYLKGFLATVFLATGGFMLMPFGSAFGINNLKISLADLPLLYGVTGFTTIIFGPLLGKLSDSLGKYRLFVIGSIISIVMVLIYTNMGETPLWIVMILNVGLFIGISSRMISGSALMTAVPEQKDRGAFMSINSSIQQISGGIAAGIAGLIVVQSENGILEHYNLLGYVVVGSMLITIGLMYILNEQLKKKVAGL
jgi:predicted MFS family arabinose efflux permease